MNEGDARRAALDAPIIAGLKGDVKTAVDANHSLQDDVARIDSERQLCSANTDRLKHAGDMAAAAKTAALSAAEARLGELEASIAARAGRLAVPTELGKTCEQTLSEIDAAMRDVALKRLRNYPPRESGSGSEDAASGSRAGSSALRVTP